MTRFVVAALAAGFAALLAAPTAQAQTAPNFPAPAGARASQSATPAEAARTQRQQQMSPEDAERDRQLQVLESRTGNTSFSMERTTGVASPGDKANGAFKVRKYKGMPGQEEKRGESKRVLLGARTTGKPLVHNKKKHNFLFF